MKMKRLFSTAVVALSLSLFPATSTVADEVDEAVRGLQAEWGIANYKTSDENKEAAFKALVDKAEALSGKHAERAEPKIWEAIIRAGYAGAMGGVSSMFNAMPQMEKGRDLLLEAEKIDAKAMHGAVYTTLGSFYYMVPGGFIGFGDNDKAEAYLAKAIEVAPDDMDANYFSGDYWLERKKYKKAIPYLEKVLALPDVADRPIYSEGRKAEAAAKLAKAKKKAPPF
ncbi:tetratricopeptide repeat protein [Mariprofundus sp. NF]|uniref:tetratricopeptide repeat protein n=1 Tax=Mariprofundus sp. NF TaxID=2608716 RepID=UPI001F508888|nr:tetratricopeptide repeat protein [Mariprofundus sp. NF]